MSELKPCPLCNSENTQLIQPFFDGYGPDCLCMKCGCKADKKAWQGRTQSQCELIDMNNLRNCISSALNDSINLEVGAGHAVTNIDGEGLYNRIRGILDAITPLPPKEQG